jgi:hypothetical protein
MKTANVKDQKCTFIKKRTHNDEESASHGPSPGFCFNFDIDPSLQNSEELNGESCTVPSDQPMSSGDIPLNYYKLETTDNNFKFNFTNLDNT